jgi:transposase InsO family protein
MLKAPEKLNEVLQGDFTDYVTEDGEKYRIGCVTEYLSRFNLVSEVLDTETALDLIAVTEAALREITELGHELAAQVILVTDNGPAMKSTRFRNFVKKTQLLIHVRSRKYHPRTGGALSRILKAGAFVSSTAQQSNRTNRGGKELSSVLQLREAAHEPGLPHTGCGVFNKGRP